MDSIYTLIDTNSINQYSLKTNYSKCYNQLDYVVSCFISPELLILKYSEDKIDTMHITIDCYNKSNGDKLNYTPMDWNFELNIPFIQGKYIFSAEEFEMKLSKTKFERIESKHILDNKTFASKLEKEYSSSGDSTLSWGIYWI